MPRTIIERAEPFFRGHDNPTAWLTTDHPASCNGDPVLIMFDDDTEQVLGIADAPYPPYRNAAEYVLSRQHHDRLDDPHGHIARFVALGRAAGLTKIISGVEMAL